MGAGARLGQKICSVHVYLIHLPVPTTVQAPHVCAKECIQLPHVLTYICS